MKKRKFARIISLILIVPLLLLPGCSKSGDVESKDNNETEANSQEGLLGQYTSKSEDEENKNNNETETNSQEGLLEQYTSVVLDRSLVEGKFAVYFLRSAVAHSSYTGRSDGGDSALFISPDGKTLLYDCNTIMNSSYIAYALQELGIKRIDYFVNSHPHIDHLGGFRTIARYFEIGQVYLPSNEAQYDDILEEGGYTKAFLDTIKENNIPYTFLKAGDTFQFGNDVRVNVYNPPEDLDFDNVDENEWSLLLKFVYKDSSVLIGGDIGNNGTKLGRNTESELLAKYGSELQADVAKMNHHGESKATKSGSREWRETVNPKIWVGMRTVFQDDEQFLRYGINGEKTFHSALDGTVLVYTSGNRTYEVQVERERIEDVAAVYGTNELVNGHVTVK